jgi:hypothetical protein
MGITDGWVAPEPLVDELTGLERSEDGVPCPEEDELAELEVGTEDEYGERENDGEAGEEDRLEGVGNDNDGPRDDGKGDE